MTDLLRATKLFGRALKLNIGVPNDPLLNTEVTFNDANSTGMDVSGFDVEFSVERSLKSEEPNTCDIRVYNLSETSRKAMSGGHKLTVSLEAGYQGNTSLLFLGEVRNAWTDRQGPDFVTHLESGDGEEEIRKARLNVCHGAKVPVASAVAAIVDALKLGQGNTPVVAAALSAKGIATINGGALTGPAAARLTDFCRSAGLEWSVQHGAIQILDVGKTVSPQALRIAADTGLIDSPTVDNKGVLNVTTLIIPGLQPGVLAVMDTLFVKGAYRIEKCQWKGQVLGNDWSVSWEGKKY